MTTDSGVVRRVARDITALIAAHPDPTAARAEVEAALSPLIPADAELFEGALPMPGLDLTRMLYFDPELVLLLSKFDPNFALPVHNHEAWNVLMVCSGEMHFRWYRRLDDLSEPGRADLEIADDRVLTAGGCGIIGLPPHDIHQLEVLTDDTWLLTVTPQVEPEIREIYDPASGTYEVKPLTVVSANAS